MKNIFYLFILIIGISACKKINEENGNNPLVGKWKLIEQLSDPGDGSGVFTTLDSDKTIEFMSDGKVESNGDLCFMSATSNSETTAEFDDDNKKIINLSCKNEEVTSVFYEIKDSKLILHYLCIEPCAQKYEKVK